MFLTNQDAVDLVAFRHDLHRRPEISGEESETARAVTQFLKASAPDRIVTECLACRLQFTQMQAKPVVHPVELLADAYRAEAAPGKAKTVAAACGNA